MKGVINRGIVMEVIGATVVVLALAALCYIVPPVHDDDSHAVTGTSIASDTTLSISLSGSVLPLDLTPTSSSGTFATTVDGDTHATIRVSTNNITGYTLGIKAVNSNSDTADKLVSSIEQCENTPTSTKCSLSSLSQPVSSAEYIDNTVEGIDLNNTWGYAPSYYNSAPNTTTTTTLDPNTNEDITTISPINYYPAPVNGDTIVTTDSPNQEDTNITTSLCPAGWHLPYGNTGTSGNNLGGIKGSVSYLGKQIDGTGLDQYTAEASNRWRSFPNNFVYAGNFWDSSVYNRSVNGMYRSTTAKMAGSSYVFSISRTYYHTYETSSKHYGFSIRCVMR